MQRQNYGSFADMATQHMLAPILDNLVADEDFNSGELFIFNNELYKATTNISEGDPITIGPSGNADYASDLSKAILEKYQVESITATAVNASSNVSIFSNGINAKVRGISLEAGTYMADVKSSESSYYYVSLATVTDDDINKIFREN